MKNQRKNEASLYLGSVSALGMSESFKKFKLFYGDYCNRTIKFIESKVTLK